MIAFKKLQEYIEHCRVPEVSNTHKNKGTTKLIEDKTFDSKQFHTDSKTSS